MAAKVDAIEAATFNVGKLTVNTLSDLGAVSVRCDRAAIDEYNTLYVASVVGPGNAVKKLRAALHTKGNRCEIQPDGLEFIHPNGGRQYPYGRNAIRRCEYGYDSYTERMDYGYVHAVFVSKSPLLLVSVSDEALWRRLKSKDFTTPLLRGWMPWITAKLIDNRLLRYTYGHRVKCGTLLCGSDSLDLIVQEGIQDGHLRFEEAPALAVA